MPFDDILADLPAPRNDEPASLRQDIVDELADHLGCAFRRELIKTGHEDSAKRQVLDRFGDPRRIARQLWWQAMWSRIMLNRIALGIQGLLAVGVIVVAFLLVRVLEFQMTQANEWQVLRATSASNQQMLTMLLQRLPTPPEAAQPTGGDASGGGSAMGGMMPGMGGGGTSTLDEMAGFGGGPGTIGRVTKSIAGPELSLLLTVEGQPAVDCVVSVMNEQGVALLPQPASGADRSASMGAGVSADGMMHPGGFPVMMGMAGGGYGGGGSFPRHSRQSEVPGLNRILLDGQGDWLTNDWNGRIHYGPVEPGRYSVSIEFSDGRTSTQRFAVPPGKKQAHQVDIDCPPPAAFSKAFVTFMAPKLDERLAMQQLALCATLIRQPTRAVSGNWASHAGDDHYRIRFDPSTGVATTLFSGRAPNHARPTTNLGDLEPAERFITLPAGKFRIQFDLRPHEDFRELGRNLLYAVLPAMELTWPAAGAASDGLLTITAETRDVLLELPEGALEQALAATTARNSGDKDFQLPFQPVTEVPTPSDSDAAKTILNALGLTLEQLAVDERRQVAEKHPSYHGGMKISAITPDSPADQLKLQKGDILVGIEDHECLTHENVAWILNHWREPRLKRKSNAEFFSLKVRWLRDEQVLYATLEVPSEVVKQSLPAASPSDGAAKEARLRVKVQTGPDEARKPPERATIEIHGTELINQATEGTRSASHETGIADFGRLLAGNYRLKITTPRGTASKAISVPPGETYEVAINAPAEGAPVALKAPTTTLPADLRDAGLSVFCKVAAVDETIDELTWKPGLQGITIIRPDGDPFVYFDQQDRFAERPSFEGPGRTRAVPVPGTREFATHYIMTRLGSLVFSQRLSPARVGEPPQRPAGMRFALSEVAIMTAPKLGASNSPEFSPFRLSMDRTIAVVLTSTDGDWPEAWKTPYVLAADTPWKFDLPESFVTKAREEVAKLGEKTPTPE